MSGARSDTLTGAEVADAESAATSQLVISNRDVGGPNPPTPEATTVEMVDIGPDLELVPWQGTQDRRFRAKGKES